MRLLEDVLRDLAEQDQPIRAEELINRVELDLSGEATDARVVAIREQHPAVRSSEQLRPLLPPWNPIAAAAAVAGVVILIVGLPLLLLRGGDSPAVDEPPTQAPMTTTQIDTSVSTTAATAETVGLQRPIVDITFDGGECVVEGPTSAQGGTGQAFVLTNDSDTLVTLRVARIRYDHFDVLAAEKDGVRFETFDDLVAIHESDPAAIGRYFLLEEERFSFDPEHYPSVDRAANQRIDVRLLRATQGENAIYVESVALERIWFCGPLQVTAIEF